MGNVRQRLVFSSAIPLLVLLPVSQAQPGNDAATASPIAAAAAESVITCLTGDSLLDTPLMRQLLRVLWTSSHPNEQPVQRRERGAIIFDSSGVLFYRADLDNPHDTPCRSAVVVPLGSTPVAAVFTHPFRPGDLLPLNCPFGDNSFHRYTVDQFGGPSEEDIVALLDWQLPGYIMDQENVYAIPLGATTETASSLVKRYPRIQATIGCNVI